MLEPQDLEKWLRKRAVYERRLRRRAEREELEWPGSLAYGRNADFDLPRAQWTGLPVDAERFSVDGVYDLPEDVEVLLRLAEEAVARAALRVLEAGDDAGRSGAYAAWRAWDEAVSRRPLLEQGKHRLAEICTLERWWAL